MCDYYRTRTKKGKKIGYCTKFKQVTDLFCKKDCKETNYTKEKKKANTTHKKVKIKVSQQVYQEVYKRDNGVCRLCKTGGWVEAHHILYKSQRRDLINEPKNLIILCKNCHLLVHTNKNKYQPILQEIIKKIYEEQ